MAEYVKIKQSLLTDIANAIRSKFGLAGKFTPTKMAEAITNVSLEADAMAINQFLGGTLIDFSNANLTGITSGGFAYQRNLVSVDLPNVTAIENADCFYNCNKLESVNLPNLINVNTSRFIIGCTALKNIVLPKLKILGNNSISYTDGLEKIDFHTIQSIGNYVFAGCDNLVTVILRSNTVCSLAKSCFANTPIANGTGYIYVPSALVESYKTATNWSDFANQIRAIEDYPDICGT